MGLKCLAGIRGISLTVIFAHAQKHTSHNPKQSIVIQNNCWGQSELCHKLFIKQIAAGGGGRAGAAQKGAVSTFLQLLFSYLCMDREANSVSQFLLRRA